ncbi:hypothetical protein CU669_10965 [Paramagnetospirillum kuznetsovii]|uniref:Uncharacterized protein n=1 Tax=Paramagnetospirillum kuznetsovii TaxID=2053833 RepID=A0A364NXJ2_9PROT|nr:radical SAM protein [Paramagnetospirillum kuznetsovii]RAU21819.1 hypothetical protein CU669_10965 [Paramagnetospirillum kuznetsovii]
MIILLNPPFLDNETSYHFNYSSAPYPNPAIGLLAAVLHQHGLDYAVIDAQLNAFSLNDTLALIAEKSAGKSIAYIGVSNSATTLIENDMTTIRAIRTRFPGVPIVIGGAHSSAMPERTLNDCAEIDVVARFEGIQTVVELHDYYTRGGNFPSLADIKGIAYRNEGMPIRTPERPRDNRRWSEVGPSRFAEMGPAKTYMLFTAIGCPFRCSYCFNATNFNFSTRSIDAIIAELKYVVFDQKCSDFWLIDATFAINRKHTEAVLRRMIDEGIAAKARWACTTRVNAVDDDLLLLMKAAGCYLVSFGVESTVDKVLERANKKTSRDMILDAFRGARRAKLQTNAFIVYGHIGETEAEILDTMETIVKINPDELNIGVMVPWPGTEVYDLAAGHREGLDLMDADFKKYDKYFGSVLKHDGISHQRLEFLRVQTYLKLFIANHRYADFIKFCWTSRKGIYLKFFSRFGLGRTGVTISSQ